MDRATPALSADPMGRLPNRFVASANSSSTQSLRSGLFEQILSLPAPMRIERQPRPERENEVRPDPQPSSESSSAAPRDDGPPESTVPTAEENAEQGAVEDQVALLNATPLPVPIDEHATAVEETNQTTATDQQLLNAAGKQSTDDSPNQSQTPLAERVQSPLTDNSEALRADAERTDAQPTISDTAQAGSQSDAALAANRRSKSDAAEAAATRDAQAADELTAGDLSQPMAQESTASTDDPHTSIKSNQPSAAQTAQPSESKKDRSERREKWYERGTQPIAVKPAESESASSRSVEDNQVDKLSTQNLADVGSAGVSEQSTSIDQSSASAQSPENSFLETTVTTVSSAIATGDSGSGILASTSLVNSLASLDAAAGEGTGNTSTPDLNGTEQANATGKNHRSDAKAAAAPTQHSDELTQAERVRLVQRVSRSFSRIGPNGGQINIKLHPPQLGSLSVQVRLEGRSMTAKLTTETGAARDAILENLPVLRGRLEEQGYQIASFQVEVADNHGDINSGNNLAQHSFDQSQGQAGDSRSQATDYRRLAMMQRQQMENAGNAGYALPPRDLGWEMMAGIDLHA